MFCLIAIYAHAATISEHRELYGYGSSKITTTSLRSFLFAAVLLILVILGLSIPFGPDRVATTYIQGTPFGVSVELYNAHPFLAEYERVLVFSESDEIIARAEMFMDSGGHDEVYLFRAGPTEVYVVDVVYMWKLDLVGRQVVKQDVPYKEVEDFVDHLEYAGKFAGAGSRPWRFEIAAKNERPIMKRMKGG